MKKATKSQILNNIKKTSREAQRAQRRKEISDKWAVTSLAPLLEPLRESNKAVQDVLDILAA